MSYVNELKEIVMEKVKGMRDDLEDLNEKLIEKRWMVGWIGGDDWLEYKVEGENSEMVIEWRNDKKGDGEEKEELFKVLNRCKVLVCGLEKRKSRYIGLFSECCCIYYEKGKEKWYIEGDLFWRSEYEGSEWKCLKIERK